MSTRQSRNIAVPVEQLAYWARFADLVRRSTFPLQIQIARRQYAEADARLTELNAEASAALASMEKAGAERPRSLLAASEVPLKLLATPANRRLALLLREAVEVAAEVDQERGYSSAVRAQQIEEIAAEVDLEVYGPSGHGEG
jgi:hypothetical protein